MDLGAVMAENRLRGWVNEQIERDTREFELFKKSTAQSDDVRVRVSTDLAERPQLSAKYGLDVAIVIITLRRCVWEHNMDKPNTRMLFQLAVELFLEGRLSARHLVFFTTGYCGRLPFKPDAQMRYVTILERSFPHKVGAPFPDSVQVRAYMKRLLSDNFDVFASKRMTVHAAAPRMAFIATQMKFPHELDAMFMLVGRMVVMGYAVPQDLIDIPIYGQTGFRFKAETEEYILGEMFRPAREAVAVQAAVVALSFVQDKSEAKKAAEAAYAQALAP